MLNVFIDGSAGTTGLRIRERLHGREDIRLLTLADDVRKDKNLRQEMIHASDLTFLCLPDETAIESVYLAQQSHAKIIDASTAHRTVPGWAYGFPELSKGHREAIQEGNRIAVPGCHASGFIALIYPLIKNGLLDPSAQLCCHSITGYSGGGNTMISEYEGEGRSRELASPRQYATAQRHKHLPEMTAITGLLSPPVFTPIVSDYYGGMTVSVMLFGDMVAASPEEITACYRHDYQNHDVLRVLPFDGNNAFVAANRLAGRDAMEIKVEGNRKRMVLTACFDNLGKGASGAAMQCMNLMFGLPESTGLML